MTKKHRTETALFGAGCFWGVEKILQNIPGVIRTTVGYAGGELHNPSYQQICTGTTGHAEVVEVEFDTDKVSYEILLDYFFRLHDPTTKNRQGNDIGSQYRSVIFCQNERQCTLARQKKEKIDQLKIWPRPLITEIVKNQVFYPAEEYHQKYLMKNPTGYCNHFLRTG